MENNRIPYSLQKVNPPKRNRPLAIFKKIIQQQSKMISSKNDPIIIQLSKNYPKVIQK